MNNGIPSAYFEAEDQSIKVLLQKRDGELYVTWNDEQETHVSESYVKTLPVTEVYYIGQLSLMIDELENPTEETDK